MSDHELEYGSDEWAEAWTMYPDRITRHLTPAQRCDPALNPSHPFAPSWPPGREDCRDNHG